MNNVSLVGRLTKDPERRQAKNGTSCCMFQLAVDRGLRSASGDKVVDFIPCSAWAVSCDFLCKYAHKGDMLFPRLDIDKELEELYAIGGAARA